VATPRSLGARTTIYLRLVLKIETFRSENTYAKLTSLQWEFPMTTKELAIQTINRLPDSADWTQIEERIHFAAGLRKELYELDHGEGIAHSVVKEEFAEWISNI
jgi:hypothetical protein